ncbi:hypothetical protein [Levilactobacillus yonginensis]|uniref:hypothetical protein n=1 Tax=Levilactobacillus yonginensis TaxID=1054041 RepID=UPI00345C92F5
MASFNHISEWIERSKRLNQTDLIVGVPIDDSFLQMVARVNEHGMVIRAKKSFLTIPTAAAKGRKPSEIPGLFRPKGAHNHVLAVADKSAPYGMTIMFVLKESVRIPPRRFLWIAYERNHDAWNELMVAGFSKVMDGKQSVSGLESQLGRRISNDIKKTIRDLHTPRNAGLTADRKGFDDPLQDTGKLIGSITWANERKL